MMSIDAKTEHGEFKFRVSEFEKGAYVSTEPLAGPGLSVLQGNTSLFLTLKDDSFENA
jgi:hypothetical protein